MAHLAQPSSLHHWHHDRQPWARTDSEPEAVAVTRTPTRSQTPSGAPKHEFSDRDWASSSSDAGRGPATGSAHNHGVIIGLRVRVAVWHNHWQLRVQCDFQAALAVLRSK
jgi:hypothetical protein